MTSILSRLKVHTTESITSDLITYYKQKNVYLIRGKLQQILDKTIQIQDIKKYNAKSLDRFKNENDARFTDFVCYIQYYLEWIYLKEEKKESKKKCLEFFINQTTQQLLNFFENITENEQWFLAVIKFHLNSIKRVYKSELETSSSTIVMKIRMFLQFSRKGVHRRGLYQVILNLYMSIYFQCFNYALCSQTLNSESQLEKELPLQQSSKSEKIIFLYYTGRMRLFQNKFSESQYLFENALQLCQKKDIRHQRSVLKFLIPVKMFCGSFPQASFLLKYQLFEYVEISKAILVGNLYLLDKNSSNFRKLWIQRGLFLLFDKLRLICLRNLFRKVWILFKKNPENAEKNQIPLEYFKKAYEISTKKNNVDEREVACIIGNLCMMKFVKGYIFNTNTVVLKKGEDPFPKISSVVQKMVPDIFS